MNNLLKYLSFVILCGCEINTPPLPLLEDKSFSYDQAIKQQKQLQNEVDRN